MKRARNLFKRFSDWFQPNEAVLLSVLAILLGTGAGLGVWGFKALITWFHGLFFTQLGGWLEPLGAWTVLLLPVLGGLLVGLMMHWLVGEERHQGVAGIMEAVALAGGRLRYARVPVKVLAAALGIGSGASVGPEDPSVQIGANLGSLIGQKLRLSEDRVRALVAAGSAAGIAAAFNAPIAGVFFALEVILGEIGGSAFGAVVIAAVSSAAFTQAVSGAQPAFRVPAYPLQSALEMPLYLLLGLIAGGVSALYIRGLYTARDLFQRLKAPEWIKPAGAGLIVGLVGIFLPQLFGVGYDTIEGILAGREMALGLLLALVLGKIFMTSTSIGGGFQGGVFAPSIFIGAALGGAFGQASRTLLPELGVLSPAFAMVGMAAVLAGAVHAPLTAILLLFEMTNDYRIILPVMLAVAVSLPVSQLLIRDSVYTLALARKGIRLRRGRDVEVLQAITVDEVMQTEFPTLPESASLTEATETLVSTRRHGLPVVDEAGRLVGLLTLQDIDRAKAAGHVDGRVGDYCARELLLAHPDETIGEALRKMSRLDIGRMPVTPRADPTLLLGMLRRNDVIRAYDAALTRRAELRHKAHLVRLGASNPEEVRVLEIEVEAGAPCAGKHVREIAWPAGCVIASLRRGRHVLIPHGETQLRAGDVLIAVINTAAEAEVARICRRAA